MAPGDNQLVGRPGPNPGNPLLPGWFAGGGGGGKGIDNQSIDGGVGGAWGGSELSPDHLVDHLLVQALEVETVVALVKLDQMHLQPLVVVAEDAEQTLNHELTEEVTVDLVSS